MAGPTQYRVDIGEDCYIGSAEEVVDFMRKAEGAPQGSLQAYMDGVRDRIAAALRRGPIDTSTPTAFLASLDEHGVLQVATSDAPSLERLDPAEVLRDRPIVFGPNVDPHDFGG